MNHSVQGKPRDESFEMALTEPLGTGEVVGAEGEGAERDITVGQGNSFEMALTQQQGTSDAVGCGGGKGGCMWGERKPAIMV